MEFPLQILVALNKQKNINKSADLEFPIEVNEEHKIMGANNIQSIWNINWHAMDIKSALQVHFHADIIEISSATYGWKFLILLLLLYAEDISHADPLAAYLPQGKAP